MTELKSTTLSETSAAFQGELGAFSHSAAQRLLPSSSSRVVPLPRFVDLFDAVKTGRVTHAVVPIENTLHGSVHENYDHLLEYKLPIVGETSIRISHQLIALPGTQFSNLRKVFSHPVALNQCQQFFEMNPTVEQVPFYDTAGSVKMLVKERPEAAAAIASESAAEIYGGEILLKNIEDNHENFTRFFLLAKHPDTSPRVDTPWKTSLVFSAKNLPGVLFKTLACFALRDINLTKIESRPLRGKPWEYFFYVDLIGRAQDQHVRKAIEHLEELTTFLHILGTYQPTT